jgi:hypothetical protein
VTLGDERIQEKGDATASSAEIKYFESRYLGVLEEGKDFITGKKVFIKHMIQAM